MAQLISKRQQIDKSANTMVVVASVAVFITVFSLFSAHALVTKLTFNNKVMSARTAARNKLKTDITAANNLTNSYESFNGSTTNLLGGNVTGNTNDNAKIVLDALPSTYDYPALTTSLQNLLSNQGVNVGDIGGTDETGQISTSPGGPPVAMPFSFTVDGPYQNVQNVITTFEKSIRPFQFLTLSYSGSQSDISLNATGQTYFQPPTQFTITQKKVQ